MGAMSGKTSVSKNRVTIDDFSYEVKTVTAGSYKVIDQFGGHIGNFTMRGKEVVAEDYELPDAHPVAQIGKLWAIENLAALAADKAASTSKMVCSVAFHAGVEPADVASARAYRDWLKRQPGIEKAFVAQAAGKMVTISIWRTAQHLSAAKGKTPEGVAVPTQTTTDVYNLMDDL
jgi:hypothetical protein